MSSYNKKETTIRVGTTGDYKPMTWYDNKEKKYLGFDIAVAHYFCKSRNYNLEFISTTWHTLNKNLAEKKFDVAMGGISVAPEREAEFSFSNHILIDKKVAVIRCVDKDKLKSFEDINKKDIRLIENIGGTNEKCARKFFTNSSLILFSNNRRIFSEIINKNADVMITDKLEADNQIKETPELCIVEFSEQYSCESKLAYMLRKEDELLLNEINHTINEIYENGEFSNLSRIWL